MSKKPEILAPGGDEDAVKAALLAGADAIYVGLPKFNARIRARNVTMGNLHYLSRLARQKNAVLFLTLNVLLTDMELAEALETAGEALKAGIDSIIVQDLGLCVLLRHLYPGVSIHASTQMTIHNSAQAALAGACGCGRVNLARELSLNELSVLVPAVHDLGLEAELFVHGAFCLSFSGQCYMSSFIGGNSGNRGACMQPCRKQYAPTDSGDFRYVLSLRDNNVLASAAELSDLGADALKIEGRIKNFHYVYTVTRAWRETLDAAGDPAAYEQALRYHQGELEKVFNRGFTEGYLKGDLAAGMFVDSPLDQSLPVIGKVKSFDASAGSLSLAENAEIPSSCQIQIFSPRNVFICAGDLTKQAGMHAAGGYRLKITGKLYGRILPGYLVVRAVQTDVLSNLLKKIEDLKPEPETVLLRVTAEAGNPLKAVYEQDGRTAAVSSRMNLEKARNQALDRKSIENHLAGGSGFTDKSVSFSLAPFDENLFLPVSELNRMRQEAAGKIENPVPRTAGSGLPALTTRKDFDTGLLVLLSPGAEAAIPERGTAIRQAFEVSAPGELRALAGTEGAGTKESALPWLPTIILEKDLDPWMEAIRDSSVKTLITGNTGLGMKTGAAGIPWIAGPPANCANSWAFEALRSRAFCSGAFFSLELNREQLLSLTVPEGMGSYLSVFGPILLMTTRQPLTPEGSSATIRDKAGYDFHILNREGWFTELYNKQILFLPEAAAQFRNRVDYMVLDLRDFPFFSLPPSLKTAVISHFADLLAGKKPDKKEIISLLPGVTSGNYKRGLQ
ncbi:MAG: U32 family peptidase [Spirochaetales bacterium]|nr:MAG: U32 family peptidase [Spirochaetales bacterium]